MKQNKHNLIHTEELNGITAPTIESLLKRGKENAISTNDLVELSGCKTARKLRELILKERMAGAIICSGSKKGYWLPKNKKEIQDFCTTMEKRAKNTFNVIKSARRALDMPEGQLSIEE